MSEEKSSEEKSGLRPAQIAAAALAAVTAALLGSTLGVAGTVVGAGLASVITTVGSELYLKSLHRTKQAALKAREMTVRRTREFPAAQARAEAPEDPEATRLIEPPAEEEQKDTSPMSRLRRLRWPLIIGTSVLAFVAAIVLITGFEGVTGKSLSGGEGTTFGKIVGGGGQRGGEHEQVPSERPTAPPASPTTTTAPPTTESSEPPTSTSKPPPSSTTSQSPTSSAKPTQSAPPVSPQSGS
ncbi:hypothetical protein [Amycolatopsis suaedae]|uniref:Uncharacterized protein n=1 Tax=Amycolatopsis suaedae TaxID=2510978 RepID=A0A4Q7J513_9PSEU|nr:hypothetical protein [Amycolatopsis suaedae]RZQ61762.1 hypothetical protein EWH70_22700 [Amycolatopsis suaedae]